MSAVTSGGISIGMTLMYFPVAALGFMGISVQSLTILAVLMLLDYITGIAKVIVIDAKTLKSYKAIAGIIAKCAVLLIPIVIALCAKQMNIDAKNYIDATITALVLAEGYSIIGNIRSIYLRKEVEEIDGISFILKKISKVFEDILKVEK